MIIKKIVDVFEAQLELSGYSRLVTNDEIQANDYNLNLPRYIDTTTTEDVQGPRFLVIPVVHAVPAVRAYLEAQQDDGSVLRPGELQELAELTMRVVRTGELLVRYVKVIGGRPHRN